MFSLRQLSLVAILLLALLSSAFVADAQNTTCSAAAGTCIRIGVFRCDNLATCTIIGYSKLIDWYINRVNTVLGGKMLGVPVQFVQGTLSGSAATKTEITTLTKNLFIGTTPGQNLVDFVVLPAGSNWDTAMVLLEAAQIPSIASNSPLSTLYQCGSTQADWSIQPPCAAANTRRFQFAHGFSSPGEQYFQSWVGLMKLKKAQSLGVVQTTVALYQTIQKGVALAASDYNIPLTYVKTVSLINGTIVDPVVIESVIDDLSATQPDGLVLATQNCIPWIQAFARRNYAPKSLATVLCTDSSSAYSTLSTQMTYVVGSAQWSPDMNGNDYTENADSAPWSLFPHVASGATVGKASPQQFQDVWQSLMNTTVSQPGYAEAAVLVGFTALEGAINLAGTPNPTTVNQQLQLYYQTSYYGLLSTNRYGANQQKQLVINQRDSNNNLKIVSPQSAATLDFIYPMPNFSDRIYTKSILKTPIEYVVIALIILCSLFTGGLMLYLWMNRGHQVFQAAGLPFYLMMGLGCILAFCSTLTWGVENNDQTCAARVWMWTICFHMFVDPLLASSWRISRIFSQKLQTVKLTNTMVGMVCLGLFTPQLIINILWTALAPLKPTQVSDDVLRPANTTFTTCSAGNDGVIFAGVTLGYSGLLLVAACYLAYKVRKAYRMFNDAKPIAMSMYIFTVTAAIILVIQIALNTQTVSAQKVLFALRSIGVLVCYQSSVSLLYFRRILGQVDVSKYGKNAANRSALEDESSDDTSDGKLTGGTPNPTTTGKMVFQKNGTADSNTSKDNKSSGAVRNVHVHIQPPAAPTGTSTPDENNSQVTMPLTPTTAYNMNRLSRGPPMPSGTPSRTAVASTGLGVSTLQLDNVGTPKIGSFRPKPINVPAVQTLPPNIPMPTPSELAAMDNPSLVGLCNQLNSQNQVLRSMVRTQNIASVAAMRGESLNPMASLPGTPDRSPRQKEPVSATPVEGLSRRSSYVNGTNNTNLASPSHPEMQMATFPSPVAPDASPSVTQPLQPYSNTFDSTSDVVLPVTQSHTHQSGQSADSTSSLASGSGANQQQISAAAVDISPVSAVGPFGNRSPREEAKQNQQ